MKTIPQRIAEFVRYHIEGDGECNNVVLKAWADEHGLTQQERYELAYWFSITYCVESAISLFSHDERWALDNKSKLVFQSDRKYIKMRDSFSRCVKWFNEVSSVGSFLGDVADGDTLILSKAIPYVSSWEMFGRFSAYLFLETFVWLTDKAIDNTTIEWRKGNTATSGLLNVYGFDKEADLFDKRNKLLVSEDKMDAMLDEVLERIEKRGGDANVTEVETSLCAYRKFYKGSRYNGYYLDRMLEEIYKMRGAFPDTSASLLRLRSELFDERFLGEKSGWHGVRKQMKKFYRQTGCVNW